MKEEKEEPKPPQSPTPELPDADVARLSEARRQEIPDSTKSTDVAEKSEGATKKE